ncbi:MAG: glycosyltransferase family 2 protein [Lachnospiraceae bacterium]|nr:glycosyltransferase family 2 protein [Lachnospiraceae bacterium]
MTDNKDLSNTDINLKSAARKLAKLAIVVPCFNEEEMLPITFDALLDVLKKMAEAGKIKDDSFLLFVNDGSSDRTMELLREASEKREHICCISLSKNCGHQNALIAGLMTAKDISDITVSIDADLQDDTSVIEKMVDEYYAGAEIVYGVRSSRQTDSFFKRTTAETFYKFMSALGVKSVYNHADFRLMSAKALEELSRYNEKNLYIRGLIPLLGFKTAQVTYERAARQAGVSKYPLKKMMGLALNGITSFSTKPLTIIIDLGITVLFICFVAAVYAFISYFRGDTVTGWTSIILSIWFLGGVQLLCLGVIGEYVGRIYAEAKGRPLYCIETKLLDGAGGDHNAL